MKSFMTLNFHGSGLLVKELAWKLNFPLLLFNYHKKYFRNDYFQMEQVFPLSKYIIPICQEIRAVILLCQEMHAVICSLPLHLQFPLMAISLEKLHYFTTLWISCTIWQFLLGSFKVLSILIPVTPMKQILPLNLQVL